MRWVYVHSFVSSSRMLRRTCQRPLPDDALATFYTVMHQTKNGYVFRRAQAVHAKVKGRRLPTVAKTCVYQFCAQKVGSRALLIRVSQARRIAPAWAPPRGGNSPSLGASAGGNSPRPGRFREGATVPVWVAPP